MCGASQIGVEDWSTLRIICDECSRGNSGSRDCKARESEDGTRNFGLAAANYEDAVRVLREWATISEGSHFKDLETGFDAHGFIERSSSVLNERRLSL